MSRSFTLVIKTLKDNGGVMTSDALRQETSLTEIPARICEAIAAGYEINRRLIPDQSKGFKRLITEYALISEVQK